MAESIFSGTWIQEILKGQTDMMRVLGPFFPKSCDADSIRKRCLQAISILDNVLSIQLDLILNHPRLLQLEASWRGIESLVNKLDRQDAICIRILSMSWRELCKDFEKSADFESSALFDKLYNQEFGMSGGEPFGLLIADYKVCHLRSKANHQDSITALTLLAQIGAASFCPILLQADPALFGVNHFSELAIAVDFSILFSGQDYARWRILQDSLDARFLGIMLPHILLKGPYSEAEKRRVPFVWEAKARYLWGNPAYSFAQVVMRSFSNFSWFGDIRGSNMQFGGGQVFDLPITKPDYDLPITENQPPIEVVFSDAQNSILSSYGFIALSVCRLRKHIVFLGNQSLYRPANRYEKKVVQANDNLAGLLQYMLCVSRFSHYLKVIVRDKIGKYTTLEDMESDLNHWLSNYVIGNEDAQFEIKSRYPLRSAKVQIKENATKPGSLACIIYLQPHFQLDHISAGFRLYTEMRSPTALS